MTPQYSKAAVKVINSMESSEKKRIKDAIEKLPAGDVKPLKGTKDSYRLRVGGRRIIFSYPEKDVVLIEKIGPRGDVYKGGK